MKIKLAIQKSGRLHDASMKLLQECGIEASNGNNQLKVEANNFPLEIYFLRDDDIPEYVQDGVADIGFVGQNVVREKDKSVREIEKLGFGRCRLSIAISKSEQHASLEGKTIATSYPKILSRWLTEQNINASIRGISGSVEIAPKIGLADAICDLVSSGSTLFINELKETAIILESECVLIANNNLTEKQQILLDNLLFRIRAIRKAKNCKYILLNAPDNKLEAITQLLPGMRSPTVLPLAKKGWSSVHSVIAENDFWNVIEKLKMNGAEGILIIPIEKMIL